MKEKIKNNLKLIIVSVIFVALSIIIITIFNQNTICSYTSKDELLEENTEVIIKYNSEVEINKYIQSEYDQIMQKEVSDNINQGFKNISKSDYIHLYKKEKAKMHYYKLIKKYKSIGYNCKMKLKK